MALLTTKPLGAVRRTADGTGAGSGSVVGEPSATEMRTIAVAISGPSAGSAATAMMRLKPSGTIDSPIVPNGRVRSGSSAVPSARRERHRPR